MSLIMDTLIAIVCAYVLIKLKKPIDNFSKYWRLFFLFLGISMFLGGFSHAFFQYTGMYGKKVTWIFAFLAGFYAGKGMLSLNVISQNTKKWLNVFLYVKFIVLLILAFYYQEFLFVTVDSALTYLVYCLGLGLVYTKKGFPSYKYTIWGVYLLVPTIIIFIFNIQISVWFNKNDLAHLIMIGSVILFYLGVKKYEEIKVNGLNG